MTITCNPTKTEERRINMEQYLRENVLDEVHGRFLCRSADACKGSHSGIFYEGQLHHLGRFYDIAIDGKPFRTVVVGQEYGGEPNHFSCANRYQDIFENCGLGARFTNSEGYPPRNPHMKGTTSALRLVFGAPLGVDHASEFLSIQGQRQHIFDAFALVNYLLCSAMRRGEGSRGAATHRMKENCRCHFREVMKILEPVIVIVQGKGYWDYMKSSFDDVRQQAEHL